MKKKWIIENDSLPLLNNNNNQKNEEKMDY